MRTGGSRPGLLDLLAELARHYPPAEELTDPLALIVRENIGYLIDDDRRRALFDEFQARVGLQPDAIADASSEVLLDIARRGGMRPETRVERWRTIARIVQGRCGGDLAGTLRSLPLAQARGLLKRFPAVGDPGADKVLLFCGVAPRPSLESNGVRVLARLGFYEEQRTYPASYRAATDVLTREGLVEREPLVRAYGLLRDHGRALCKRSLPSCLACPLDQVCAHVVVGLL